MKDTTTMTEIVLPGIVEPELLEVRTVQIPHPGAGQALVRIDATGVSFAEQSMRLGRYPGQPKFPFVPGYDLVGTVSQVGEHADPTLVGRRVAAATKTTGWATYAVRDADTLITIPDAVDAVTAEAVVVNGITAWQMLHRSARVKRGGTILVHGAGGGVGNVLAQVAIAGGIRVIGTSSPRAHEALRRQGVEPVDYDDDDLEGVVRRLSPRGVDAAFDHLGLVSAKRSHRMLAPRGTLVVYGTAVDKDSDASVVGLFIELLGWVMRKTLTPDGHRVSFYDFWGGSRRAPKRFRRRQRTDLTAVMNLVEAGEVTPRIAARFPLERAAEALRLAESHTADGKVVLEP